MRPGIVRKVAVSSSPLLALLSGPPFVIYVGSPTCLPKVLSLDGLRKLLHRHFQFAFKLPTNWVQRGPPKKITSTIFGHLNSPTRGPSRVSQQFILTPNSHPLRTYGLQNGDLQRFSNSSTRKLKEDETRTGSGNVYPI